MICGSEIIFFFFLINDSRTNAKKASNLFFFFNLNFLFNKIEPFSGLKYASKRVSLACHGTEKHAMDEEDRRIHVKGDFTVVDHVFYVLY